MQTSESIKCLVVGDGAIGSISLNELVHIFLKLIMQNDFFQFKERRA